MPEYPRSRPESPPGYSGKSEGGPLHLAAPGALQMRSSGWFRKYQERPGGSGSIPRIARLRRFVQREHTWAEVGAVELSEFQKVPRPPPLLTCHLARPGAHQMRSPGGFRRHSGIPGNLRKPGMLTFPWGKVMVGQCRARASGSEPQIVPAAVALDGFGRRRRPPQIKVVEPAGAIPGWPPEHSEDPEALRANPKYLHFRSLYK